MENGDPLVGKQIGNYRILAKINSGSFGSVYQGKHIIFEDDPVAAIKLIHTVLRSQQEHTEFIKEAQVLKKLNHPHILRILDAGFQDGVPYLVTEYAAEGSLRDRLSKSNGKPLPLDEAIGILTQIGQALHYAHERHIIHRDLKPENILFNQADEALLADFGIAVLLTSTHTGLVGVSGTPPYMAPEQFEGLASAKSDQYSLGCIAYELFTGHRPFTIPNPTLEAYWFHHAKVEPTPPTHHHPQLPAHIEQAILTALAKDRTHRYSDVLAFSNTLLKSSKEWIKEGNNYLNAMRYEEALAAYDQAIRLDQNFAFPHYGKGIALYDLKRHEEALAAYDQAIRLDPNYAFIHKGKGNALYKLKRHEEALAAYDQAIRLDPNYSIAHYDKGIALYDLKHYKEALVAFDQAIRLDPNYAPAYENKGVALSDLKRYEEALIAHNQAILLEPNSAIAYYNKAVALSDLKRYQEALVAFDQAIRFNPNSVLVYNSKGTALCHLKRFAEALAAFDQAIRLDHSFALGYNGRGNALYSLKRYEEALIAYSQAIRLNPNYALAYYNSGNALCDLKCYEEALIAYSQAIRLDPNYALTHYSKGYALYYLGKRKEADDAFEKARQLGYNG